MKTTKFIGIIGFLVAVVPLIGLPWFWKTSILVVLGLLLFGFSLWRYYRIRRSVIREERGNVVTDSYVENTPGMSIRNNSINNGRPKV